MTLLLLLTSVRRVLCQSSPQQLANEVVRRWSGPSEKEFAAVFPFEDGRETFAAMAQAQFVRRGGLARVLQSDDRTALLLLSGVPETGNSGDATGESRSFSGLYRAERSEGRWLLTKRVPLEEQGRIESQRLFVTVKPANGMDVTDDLRVRVLGEHGMGMRLNYAVKLISVSVRGRAVAYRFAGGLLWIDLPPGVAQLHLVYRVSVEEGPNLTNSGCFLRKSGHVRNQYFWHPFFDFGNAGDQADFEIEARIPKEYSLTTSVPQRERSDGAMRVVSGKSVRPTFALTLAYDRDWKVSTERVGDLRLETFLTPDFKPSRAATSDEFRSVYALLTSRFGVPRADYFAIAQVESREGDGWMFASNQTVFAAGWPRSVSRREGFPRAFLGHEIGHLWTNGAGPAVNFLSEGWATYVESLVLEKTYGASTTKEFWSREAAAYFGDSDGKATLLNDPENSGVSYSKGAWVFRMLQEAVGEAAFNRAMSEFSVRSLSQASGWEVLAECFEHQQVEGFNAREFLAPWLQESRAPRVTAEAIGRRVLLRQQAPYYALPVTVQVVTMDGPAERTTWLRGVSAEIEFDCDVSKPRIDPAGLLLLRP